MHPSTDPTILVTGATGGLGRLVVGDLLARGAHVIAGVRDTVKGADLAKLGVELRIADYNRPDTLATAFLGIDRLLLISSSEHCVRPKQHEAVIDAVTGVRLVRALNSVWWETYRDEAHHDGEPVGVPVAGG